LSWYVIQVKTGAESKVLNNLEQSGYAVYLPTFTKQTRHKRHKYIITHTFPLFPGYMFVQMDDDSPWMDVVRKRYVAGFLGADNPIPISPEVVNDLRRSESAGAFDSSLQTPAPGDPITVKYFGHTIPATVDRVTKDTVHLVAAFMGANVTIKRPLPQAA